MNTWETRDLVLVYGIWRTGTNLLMSIFREHGYLDLNEFYSKLVDDERILEIVNFKLSNILCQKNLQKCTVKLLLHHVHHMDDLNKNFFTRKFLVYRRDIFSSIISKIIAENRSNWYRSTYEPEQPEFFADISKETFLEYAEEYIFILTNFVKSGYAKIDVDYVINYEEDLIPYVENNPTDSLPSINYNVNNKQELRELFEYIYSSEVKMINDFFDRIRIETNQVEFETLFIDRK